MFFPIALSLIQFSYSPTDGGVKLHAPARTITVMFKDVESAILYRHKLKKGYQELK